MGLWGQPVWGAEVRRDGDSGVGVPRGAEVSQGISTWGQSHGGKVQGPLGQRGRSEGARVGTFVH